jgi:GxxExxY protein
MNNDGLTERIIGAAIEVHKILGPGLLESIYEEALCHEFGLRGILYERQVEVDVHYKGCIIKGQRLDIIVNREVIIELKAVREIPEVAYAQVLSYLKATGYKRGLLVNFSEDKLINGIRRISL